MSPQVAGLAEGPLTHGAAKWFLAGVCLFVLSQMFGYLELFATLPTLVRVFVIVSGLFVPLQIAQLAEFLVAFGASKRFVSIVRQLMPMQVTQLLEPLVATSASKRPLSRVDDLVLSKVANTAEAFVAV